MGATGPTRLEPAPLSSRPANRGRRLQLGGGAGDDGGHRACPAAASDHGGASSTAALIRAHLTPFSRHASDGCHNSHPRSAPELESAGPTLWTTVPGSGGVRGQCLIDGGVVDASQEQPASEHEHDDVVEARCVIYVHGKVAREHHCFRVQFDPSDRLR